MDIEAIVQTVPGGKYSQSELKAARFISVLSVIDRTILPRTITFSNGRTSIKLRVAERKARFESLQDSSDLGPCAELSVNIAALCVQAGSIKYSIHPMKSQVHQGHTIAELINIQPPSQDPSKADHALAEMTSERFGFDRNSWPVSMPKIASAQSLIRAWRANIWTRRWHGRFEAAFGANLFMVTTAGNQPYEFAIRSASKKTDIISVSPKELGHLLSTWRAHSKDS